MKVYYLLILFIAIISNAQQREILLIDAHSKEIIPYAAVKFLRSFEGTYSNEKGFFYINSSIDSIEISCLGYQTKTLNTKEIQNKTYLEPNIISLKTIQLSSGLPIEILGKKKSENYIGFGSFLNSTIHLAKRFDFNGGVVLKTIQLELQNNQTPKIVLLKIYDIDHANKPLKNILEHHIYQEIRPFEKNLKIDLIEHQILLENKSYFIVLELFNLTDEKDKFPIKVGFYKTKKTGQSFFKTTNSKYKEWISIKVPNKPHEYTLNIHITVQKIN